MGLFKKVGKALFGSGGSTGGMPNIDFLRQPAATTDYSYLINPNDKRNAAVNAGFADWTKTIGAPSSVDEVRAGMNQEQLDQILGGIQRDTASKFGTQLMDQFGRGLIEPGVGASSDIASNALAQTAAEGARTAAGVRLDYGLADLERQAAREAALRDAYGTRYGNYNAALGAYTQGMGANTAAQNDRDALYANLLSGNFNAAQDRKNKTKTKGFFGNFLDSYAQSAGKTAGGGGGASKLLAGVF